MKTSRTETESRSGGATLQLIVSMAGSLIFQFVKMEVAVDVVDVDVTAKVFTVSEMRVVQVARLSATAGQRRNVKQSRSGELRPYQ